MKPGNSPAVNAFHNHRLFFRDAPTLSVVGGITLTSPVEIALTERPPPITDPEALGINAEAGQLPRRRTIPAGEGQSRDVGQLAKVACAGSTKRDCTTREETAPQSRSLATAIVMRLRSYMKHNRKMCNVQFLFLSCIYANMA